MTDILESLAEYAPRTDTEWSLARQDAVLQAILGGPGADSSVEISLQVAVPARRRRRRATALAASAAALTAAASAIVAITLHGAEHGPVLAAGTPWNPPPGLSGEAPIDSGKYSFLTIEGVRLNRAGKPISRGSTSGCLTVRNNGRTGNFETPTKAFFARLPTDVDALETYLRSHVSGSSSLDEAVFVAVGDALRWDTDLASPRLKAAMLAVLSRTGGVVLHEGVRDYLGRTAIRADFVNQAIRPGIVESLYFDPHTFAVVGESDLTNGQPTRYSGPSPAYTSHAGPGVDPDQLSGPGFVSVVSRDSIVNSKAECRK